MGDTPLPLSTPYPGVGVDSHFPLPDPRGYLGEGDRYLPTHTKYSCWFPPHTFPLRVGIGYPSLPHWSVDISPLYGWGRPFLSSYRALMGVGSPYITPPHPTSSKGR